MNGHMPKYGRSKGRPKFKAASVAEGTELRCNRCRHTFVGSAKLRGGRCRQVNCKGKLL